MTTMEIKILISRGEEHRVPVEDLHLLKSIKAQAKARVKALHAHRPGLGNYGTSGSLGCSECNYTDVG